MSFLLSVLTRSGLVDKAIIIVFGFFVFCTPLSAKDPTRPQIAVKVKNADTKAVSVKVEQPLTAIFIKNKTRFAMIEGKIYQAGEYYRDSRIVNIEQDKVLLRSSQGNFHLTLIPNIKK